MNALLSQVDTPPSRPTKLNYLLFARSLSKSSKRDSGGTCVLLLKRTHQQVGSLAEQLAKSGWVRTCCLQSRTPPIGEVYGFDEQLVK